MTLDGAENEDDMRCQVPETTLARVSRWMTGNDRGSNNNDDLGSSSNLSSSSGSKGRSSATGNLIRKLENDKESLSLQVRMFCVSRNVRIL